uniref:Protein kinase domain-containing protein n=1 Tax=Physcomitrium patens TaxID=3218 RepID=A0A7I4F256_PHYPA
MEFYNKFVEYIGVVFKAREVDIGNVLIQCYNYNQEVKVLLKTKVVFNRKQCSNICKPLGHVIKVFEDLSTCSNNRRIDLISKECPKKMNIIPILFDVSTYEEVKHDGEELLKRLDYIYKDIQFKDHELTNYLLVRLKDLWRIEGGKMDSLEVSSDIKSLELGKIIKKGAFGKVHESKWFGLATVTKVMDASWNDMFLKEVGILASTSHPNLITYYYVAKSTAYENGESSTMNNSREKVYLVMELMQRSLSNLLEAKRSMPYYFLFDIIYQIARGMCYFYDMQIAHRGLKPDNILLNIIDDVYSFAMICSKILSGEDPFDGVNTTKELLRIIEKGERLKLPSNSDDLSKLIEKCWIMDPSQRPSFANICKRLTTLKKKLLMGIDVAKTPYFEAFKKDLKRNKSKDVHIVDALVNLIFET